MELIKLSAQSIRKEPRSNRRFGLALSAIAMLGLGLACNLANINTNTPRAQISTPATTITPDYIATAEVNIAARATQIVEAATAQSSMRPDIVSEVPKVCRSSGVAFRVFGESGNADLPYVNGGSGSLVFREQSAGIDKSEKYYFLTAYHAISLYLPDSFPDKLPVTGMIVSVWDQAMNAMTDVSLSFSGFYPLRDENSNKTGIAVVVAESKSGGEFLPKFVEPVGLDNLRGWRSNSWERIFVVHNPYGADVKTMVFTEVDAGSVIDITDKSGNVEVEVQPLSRVGNPTVTFGSSGAPVCVVSENNLVGAQVGVVQEANNFENASDFKFEPFPDDIANQVQAIVEVERVK